MEDATDDSTSPTTSARRWWAMAIYGGLYTLGGVALWLHDTRAPDGADMNDIFDIVGMLMIASGLLVTVAGQRAATRGPAFGWLAAVFFLHVGPTLTFGLWTLLFLFARGG